MNNTHTQKNYALGDIRTGQTETVTSVSAVFKKMKPMLSGESVGIISATIATLLSSVLNLVAPLLIGYAINTYLIAKDYPGLLHIAVYVGLVYVGVFIASYIQMRVMGGVAQRVLWRLRNDLFLKLQELPLAFFNQNKSGDLISRINSDTEKVNEFFSQSLIRFVGNIFMVIGTGVFVLSLNWKLGVASLLPAIGIVLFAQLVSGWVGRVNKQSFTEKGLMSAHIQESITNMKVILAYNRRDYFRTQFEKINKKNFTAMYKAGVANELFTPVFEYMGNIALLLTLGYGLYLVSSGQFAIGFLVSFVIYITKFYDPLREMARLWATLQSALAAWDRISIILSFESDLISIEGAAHVLSDGKGLLEFRNVSFAYVDGKEVLKDVNFVLAAGKTYAFVGPTGGGKTTTASLVARLFDPTEGMVYLHGKDIRSYSPQERVQKIGYILQDPYIFTGTIRENLAYGFTHDVEASIVEAGLDTLLSRFDKGLDTKIHTSSSLSLGEKQIIAFMRAVIRKPDILILDEATANIDTVTEQILDGMLQKLPANTTRIIIAHRLNTIENADSIFFVNGANIEEAGSMEHAIDMLLHEKKVS